MILPEVRGRYQHNVSLAQHTWFRVGGPAEVIFKPADIADLQHFLKHKPANVPVMPLGVGSNLLVRDGGIPGVVIRLMGDFTRIQCEGETVTVGAGALDRQVALASAQANIGGLEFLAGIPGTMGGALRMNAGAYGREIKDVLISADAVDSVGTLHTLSAADCGFTYRHAAVPDDWIFVSATLRGMPCPQAEVQAHIDQIMAQREATQPVRSRTGGSTFANPDGYKAWQLIDAAGCRGLTVGGAQISEKHCNFLINTGNATASDLEALGETARQRVLETSGITLRWEIVRVGKQ